MNNVFQLGPDPFVLFKISLPTSKYFCLGFCCAYCPNTASQDNDTRNDWQAYLQMSAGLLFRQTHPSKDPLLSSPFEQEREWERRVSWQFCSVPSHTSLVVPAGPGCQWACLTSDLEHEEVVRQPNNKAWWRDWNQSWSTWCPCSL